MRNKIKNQKGITLVALVLTIIILLILVAVTISTVLNGGLIKNAKNSQLTYNEEKEKEENILGEYHDFFEGKNYTPIIFEAGQTIPEGATYYVQASYYTKGSDGFGGTIDNGPKVGNYNGALQILTSGEKMPDIPLEGDVFVYGDYEYRYGWKYDSGFSGLEWIKYGISGWGVRVLNNNQSEYGQLCEKINGKNVTSLTNTFSNTSITKTPILPTGIVDMSWAFENTSITEPPVIPSGVTNLYSAFSNTSITEAPIIPNGVTNMSCTFSGSSITTAPIIPSSVTDMYFTFSSCTSLEGEIEINASIESSQDNRYNFCFDGTVKPIVLKGTSPILQQLAATATNNNVSVK